MYLIDFENKLFETEDQPASGQTPDFKFDKVNDIDSVIDEMMDKEFVEEPDAPPEEEKEITETPSEEKPVPPVDKDKEEAAQPPDNEVPEGEKPADTPKPEDTADSDNLLQKTLLTQEMIDKMDYSDEEKEYLSKKFLNQPISAALKSLANAQKIIGKKTTELEDLLQGKPLTQTAKTSASSPAAKVVVPQTEDPNEILKAKDNLITTGLRMKFKDMPEDEEELKAWKRTLAYEDPDKWDEFRDERKKITDEVTQVYDRVTYARENAHAINSERIDKAVNAVYDFFKQNGIDAKKYGLNLDEDDKGQNAILNEILSDPNNPDGLNPNIIQMFNGEIPIVMTDKLAMMIVAKKSPEVMGRFASDLRMQGHKAAQTKVPDKSLSNSSIPGIQKKDIKDLNPKDMSIDEIDKKLDELEKT